MDEVPAFYCRFSELIEETIRAWRAGRRSQAEYLRRAEEELARHSLARLAGEGDNRPQCGSPCTRCDQRLREGNERLSAA